MYGNLGLFERVKMSWANKNCKKGIENKIYTDRCLKGKEKKDVEAPPRDYVYPLDMLE